MNKQLSNPISTGSGGSHFEAHVQASFVTLMLTEGHAPCLPAWPITAIKLQGKIDGFETDDLIVYVTNRDTQEERKLLGQVKLSVSITKSNTVFAEVVRAAWNDFRNPAVFVKGKDAIALMTGPLSATDTRAVPWLLDQARFTKNKDEFFRNVEQANFSPSQASEKLDVIRHHLKTANNGVDVSDDELYAFLKHFNLLIYDLGSDVGVVLSLLHSHMSIFSVRDPKRLWGQVVDAVQTWNHNAGTITREGLPEDITDLFMPSRIVRIPQELATAHLEVSTTDWNEHAQAEALALANLVGAWNETNLADIEVVGQLLGLDYQEWFKEARQIIHLPDSPLLLKNGLWQFDDRGALWNSLGSRIFDQHLDRFKDLAAAVLTEIDPAFELAPDERYAASLLGKIPSHSSILREGIANGLAILGSRQRALVNCSLGKAEFAAALAVREILASADWRLWGSLNLLLPALAEAAPSEFLNAVENALSASDNPFEELFAQESGGITGRNYLTGLLWALEGLAWDEEYLVRVCVVLGELASLDPGGNWANRPINSLISILLPWYPQTLASIEKRRVAMQTLCKEWPQAGWAVLLQLLPNQHQTTSGSHKPKWRETIPSDWEDGVSREEYWQQTLPYAELAVEIADRDPNKLSELIDRFDKLPKGAFDRLLDVLRSEAILILPEEQRLRLWNSLLKLTIRHRRFADAAWALNGDLVSAIEGVADDLAPQNPFYRSQYLFSGQDFELYENSEDWERQARQLEQQRQNAIGEILRDGGIDAVIKFAKSVGSARQVGNALAYIADTTTDLTLLPTYLDSSDFQLTELAQGYVWRKYQESGWTWVDNLDKSMWINEQIGRLLSILPFVKENWDRAIDWLGEAQGHYWRTTSAFPYGENRELGLAVDKLLEYRRPRAAVACLHRMHQDGKPIDVRQCVTALLAAIPSPETPGTMDAYHAVELIKFLQVNEEVSPGDLLKVEWSYLPLLDRERGTTPKLLEHRLANDPEFFYEVLRLIYRSERGVECENEPTESERSMATNAWNLLHEWRTIPGMQLDGSFNETLFWGWLQKVKEICTETGHLGVALITIGDALAHAPPDSDGLWINRSVAEALNERDAQKMRSGYSQGVFNSRGMHKVDPTGAPERELAREYRQRAEDVENAGFQRLAVTLRELADGYDREAERIIDEHQEEALT